MKSTLLEIGCDGGSIKVQIVPVNGIFLFKINCSEFFEHRFKKSFTYLNIEDSWAALKILYPKWHQLYLVSINAQMIDLLKVEYLAVSVKNEYTKDRWLAQLTGYGIGF